MASLRERAAALAGDVIQLKREAALTDDQPLNQDLKEVRRILKSHRGGDPFSEEATTASRSASRTSCSVRLTPRSRSSRPRGVAHGKRPPHGRSRARRQAGRAGSKGSRNRSGTPTARGSGGRERDESIPSLPCPLCRLTSAASGLWRPPAAARRRGHALQPAEAGNLKAPNSPGCVPPRSGSSR
jgi:hypothetical protein